MAKKVRTKGVQEVLPFVTGPTSHQEPGELSPTASPQTTENTGGTDKAPSLQNSRILSHTGFTAPDQTQELSPAPPNTPSASGGTSPVHGKFEEITQQTDKSASVSNSRNPAHHLSTAPEHAACPRKVNLRAWRELLPLLRGFRNAGKAHFDSNQHPTTPTSAKQETTTHGPGHASDD